MAKGITLQEFDASATNRLIIKDSAGRAKVTAPSASDDIALKSTVDNAVGNLSSLQTTAKNNAVAAINELFTSVANGKQAIASAISGKGIPASGSDEFAVLANKVGQINTGKPYASGSAVTSENPLTFVIDSGGTQYELFIEVSGLTFVPKTIVVYSSFQDIEFSRVISSTYSSSAGGVVTNIKSGYSFSGIPVTFKVDGTAAYVATSFRIPVSYHKGRSVKWEAYG